MFTDSLWAAGSSSLCAGFLSCGEGRATLLLRSSGSVVAVHRLSCPVAWGSSCTRIKPKLLHWQEGDLHHWSTKNPLFIYFPQGPHGCMRGSPIFNAREKDNTGENLTRSGELWASVPFFTVPSQATTRHRLPSQLRLACPLGQRE